MSIEGGDVRVVESLGKGSNLSLEMSKSVVELSEVVILLGLEVVDGFKDGGEVGIRVGSLEEFPASLTLTLTASVNAVISAKRSEPSGTPRSVPMLEN